MFTEIYISSSEMPQIEFEDKETLTLFPFCVCSEENEMEEIRMIYKAFFFTRDWKFHLLQATHRVNTHEKCLKTQHN